MDQLHINTCIARGYWNYNNNNYLVDLAGIFLFYMAFSMFNLYQSSSSK